MARMRLPHWPTEVGLVWPAAVSGHGRITGWVLGFLPPALALILFVISPQHMRLLLDDPLGVQMLVAAILLQVVGVLIIRRIVDVEY